MERKTKRKAKDDAEELKALRAKLAEMESRLASGNRGKKRKIRIEVLEKEEDAHHDSGTSAPGASSAQALHDRET